MSRGVKVILLLLPALAMFAILIFILFVNKPVRKTYGDFVALDGKQPFGLAGPSGSDSVVLYRHGRRGVTCYEMFFSKELHDHLLSKDGQVVSVEYDTFADFGKIHRYNVHSIDGFLLTDGNRLLRPDFAAGSGVRSAGNGKAGSDDCW
jgi:hypothetical protein